MATYVALIRYTTKGIESVRDSPSRLEGAKEMMRGLGVELKQFYLLMGEYDVMYIMEAENDEAIARASLALGASGKITLQTMRAFTEDEYRAIVASPGVSQVVNVSGKQRQAAIAIDRQQCAMHVIGAEDGKCDGWIMLLRRLTAGHQQQDRNY